MENNLLLQRISTIAICLTLVFSLLCNLSVSADTLEKGNYSSNAIEASITYGTSTALRANTYTKSNRTFQFWNAYWSEKNKWYYQNADGSAKGWYKEGYQPAGYQQVDVHQ